VAIVGKILEHEIEQVHRLCDLGFQHFEVREMGSRVFAAVGAVEVDRRRR
jgi:hypothetical protein